MLKLARRIALFSALAVALLAFGYLTVLSSADRLIQSESRFRADAWAESLLTQVSDIKEIIEGEQPSEDSILFMEQARTIGDIWEYKLYDKKGKLVLVSSKLGQTHRFTETLDGLDFNARQLVKDTGVAIRTREGKAEYEPKLITDSIVPVVQQGELIGYLHLEVDESKRAAENKGTISHLALSLLAILLIGFGGPAAAYMLSAQKKEKAEDQLAYLAFHDDLTGLKNRSAINRVLHRALENNGGSTTDAGQCVVHMIDLDNFKGINDTLGHEAGDALLKEVAVRLRHICNMSADVGRLGGDEFIIVQPGVKRAAQAEALAGQVIAALKRPMVVGGNEIECGASIGFASYPTDARTSSELLKCADTALYVSKSNGRGMYCAFKPEHDAKMVRRRLVETKLRQAMASKGFTLAFQPLFDLASKRIVSVEALLRLHDPEIGSISPGEFIPVAEEAGLIDEIGEWVIYEACRALALLPKPMSLALNLSPVQFQRGDLLGTVTKAIASSKIDPRRLELEITESLLLKDSSETQDKIKRLKALGCAIVLDDFGAGYSSLSYLWRYPFSKLKIDREFVAAMTANPDVAGIVEIMVHLAKKLNMKVTAEGVETYDQELALVELGCDQVQGFLYAKPMPMADLAPFFLRDIYTQVDNFETKGTSNENLLVGNAV
jgi:diguanylate cyclase (GGDEF)-like protein